MAHQVVTYHPVVCQCTEAELVERVTRIVDEHVSGSREGIVPALLAENLVGRLRAQRSLYFLRELELGLEGDG